MVAGLKGREWERRSSRRRRERETESVRLREKKIGCCWRDVELTPLLTLLPPSHRSHPHPFTQQGTEMLSKEITTGISVKTSGISVEFAKIIGLFFI